ncbi:hypothetical protein BC567DRAFT_217806 [Phyllosticta citribraziliensis]
MSRSWFQGGGRNLQARKFAGWCSFDAQARSATVRSGERSISTEVYTEVFEVKTRQEDRAERRVSHSIGLRPQPIEASAVLGLGRILQNLNECGSN